MVTFRCNDYRKNNNGVKNNDSQAEESLPVPPVRNHKILLNAYEQN